MLDISAIPADAPLRVIIGAGQQAWPGWIATQGDELNLLRREQWEATFGERRIDALLCEHAWEHLTKNDHDRAEEGIDHYAEPPSEDYRAPCRGHRG